MPAIGFFGRGVGVDLGSMIACRLFGGSEQLGWVDRLNVAIEVSLGGRAGERLPIARGRIGRLTSTLSPRLQPGCRRVAKRRGTIPIVFVGWHRPGRSGLVDSLARPGGNVTGCHLVENARSGKRVELSARRVEVSPRASGLRIPPVLAAVWCEFRRGPALAVESRARSLTSGENCACV